jgi:hypothetical protein
MLNLYEAIEYTGQNETYLLELVENNEIQFLGLVDEPIFKRKALEVHRKLLVIDFHTGQFYKTPFLAAKSIGMNANELLGMLTTNKRNRSPFRLV